MQETVAYINFDGRCADAFQVYAEVLGGSIESVSTFNDFLRQENSSVLKPCQVRHAVLRLNGLILIGCDGLSGPVHPGIHRFALSIDLRCEQQALRAFMAFAKDGFVIKSFQPTGTSAGVGTVIDQFGILWTISSAMAPAT